MPNIAPWVMLGITALTPTYESATVAFTRARLRSCTVFLAKEPFTLPKQGRNLE